MKLLASTILFMLGIVMAACSGASAATVAPATSPPPTLPPTATPLPTPDITLYSQMDLSGGDAEKGLIVATSFQCRSCHDGIRTEKGPRFTTTGDLPPILERGEMRIADPTYKGQAATNMEYIFESIFIPEAYQAPGEWAVTMHDDFAQRIEAEELAHLLAWLETFE